MFLITSDHRQCSTHTPLSSPEVLTAATQQEPLHLPSVKDKVDCACTAAARQKRLASTRYMGTVLDCIHTVNQGWMGCVVLGMPASDLVEEDQAGNAVSGPFGLVC